MPTDVDTYLGNINKYTQVHVEYSYIAMSPDPYVPLKESQHNLHTCMGVVHYCENAHLLRHRSEHGILSNGFSNKSNALQSQICNYPETQSYNSRCRRPYSLIKHKKAMDISDMLGNQQN